MPSGSSVGACGRTRSRETQPPIEPTRRQSAALVAHSAASSTNPATGPVHTFHLGLWFNDPADSVKAGCANAVTPFNGDHNAGPQALSTKNFANDQGPLRMLTP